MRLKLKHVNTLLGGLLLPPVERKPDEAQTIATPVKTWQIVPRDHGQSALIRADPLATKLYHLALVNVFVQEPTADPRPSLENRQRRRSCLYQAACCHKSREACPDDHDGLSREW
ncbi:MAG TPA: hypothetical protein VGY30_04500 [Solirubrobacteraceae bacterium]|nr:hypothetical protein [Solirubrobacteraceae bacterium]